MCKQDEARQKIKEVNEELRRTDLSKIDDRKIFHPRDGYGKRLAECLEALDMTVVQLRRIYHELKSLYNKAKKVENLYEIKPELYRLYAIVEYQANRGVIKKEFKDLVHTILDKIDNDLISNATERAMKSLEKAHDFMMSIVAYSKTSKKERGG